ncbi:MAG: hypothetical protein ACRD4C_10840 [Candidatus Acidiferrales bacterium]
MDENETWHNLTPSEVDRFIICIQILTDTLTEIADPGFPIDEITICLWAIRCCFGREILLHGDRIVLWQLIKTVRPFVKAYLFEIGELEADGPTN